MAQFSNYTAIDTPADADIFLVYDDSAGATRKVTLQQLGDYIDTDQGFVTGPGSSTDNAVARFDSTTGKIVQASGVIIDDSNNVTGVASLTTTDLTASGAVILKGSTMSAYGATLIDDEDAATARTTLGLVIGTNVQAYDADLTAIAALSPSANNLIYKNGSDAWDVTTITTFGASLIDDANASTARSTLGLGNVENTALSTWAGTSNVTTVGALASGSINWSGPIVTTQGLQGSMGTFTGAFSAQTTARIGANTLTEDATYDNAVIEGSGGVGLSILTQTAGGDAGIMLGGPSNTTGAMFRYNQASANAVLATRIAGHSLVLRGDANVTNLTLSGASGSELATFARNVSMANLPTSDPGVAGRLYNDAGTVKVSL